MYYLYLKLKVFLEGKVQPKSVLKEVVFFIYSIDIHINTEIFFFLNNFYAIVNCFQKKERNTLTHPYAQVFR